jgi:hypothetical protein
VNGSADETTALAAKDHDRIHMRMPFEVENPLSAISKYRSLSLRSGSSLLDDHVGRSRKKGAKHKVHRVWPA